MNYQNYNIEDFINDDSFVKWVLNADLNTSAEWNSFIDRFPEKREEVQTAISLILNVKPGIDPAEISKDADQIWLSLHHKLTHHKLQNSTTPKRRLIFGGTWLQVAAILTLISGLTFMIYQGYDVLEEPIANNEDISKTVKFNPKGRKSTIFLSDKTRVELNSQSKIEYIDQFSPSIRELTLTGEAFFDVERDENRPFVINVNGITVKVLGTSFNIKGYPGDNHIQVAVASGVVEVYDISSNSTVNLTKNQLADYSYTTGDFSESEIEDNDLIFGWKDQKLVFRNQDLASIVDELSRWYGVDVKMEGLKNNNKRITGIYENASLREVMEGLAHNYHIKYELNGKTLKIYN